MNDCCEVMATFDLMLCLQLEVHLVPENLSVVSDSLMLDIKLSSSRNENVTFNYFGKVNKSSAHFVIEVLCIQLLLNNWHLFRSQAAPSPYAKYVGQEIYLALGCIQQILIQ
jgi:hypothetical protein